MGVAVCRPQSVRSLAQNHEATAFAIDQSAAPRGVRQATMKRGVAGDTRRMELGIAAGQEDRIGIRGRRLVGKGREGTSSAPCLLQPSRMWR